MSPHRKAGIALRIAVKLAALALLGAAIYAGIQLKLAACEGAVNHTLCMLTR